MPYEEPKKVSEKYPLMNVGPREVREVKEVLTRLCLNEEHGDPTCFRACCTYREYLRTTEAKKGRKFDWETFFLEWLSHAVIYFARVEGGPTENYSGIRVPLPFPEVPAIYRETSRFIEKYLGDLGNLETNPKRIKMKVWRLRKSGILKGIERRLLARAYQTGAIARSGIDHDLMRQMIDFILSRPRKKIEESVLLRHFPGKDKMRDFDPIFNFLNLEGGVIRRGDKDYIFERLIEKDGRSVVISLVPKTK